MKSDSAKKIQMASFDDLFGAAEAGSIRHIPLSQLHSFKNHPFRVQDDAAMQELVESIRTNGVLSPGIARPDGSGGYELVSGHRRKHACELAGLTEMPFVVQELRDDEAAVIMVDANLQREHILPSEKAYAYRMKHEALSHSGKKAEFATADVVGAAGGDSGRTVQRYIRLTELSEGLLAMVDDGSLSLGAGEALSYLTKEEQKWLTEAVESMQMIPSTAQAMVLKAASALGKLTDISSVYALLVKKERKPAAKLTLPQKKLSGYFPDSYTAEQMEEVIYGLLEDWSRRMEG